jgi:CHAT domain-containing protein
MTLQVGRFVACAVVLVLNPPEGRIHSAKLAARMPSPVQIIGLSGYAARASGAVEIRPDCHRQNVDAAFSHRCGVALLVVGRANDAVRALTRATERSPDTPAYWSDLAVGLQALARLRDAPQFLPDALAAADQSLRLDDDYIPALFARASTLASMGVDASATRGYEVCLRLVPNTPWGREANHRLQALRQKRPEYNEVSLKEALAFADDARLDDLCRDFTPHVITYAEDVLLVQWANHTLTGEPAKAASVLRTTERLARALHRTVADTAVIAHLTAIDAADEKQRLALATGHRLFGAARKAYASGLMDEARKDFQVAANHFQDGGSMEMWLKAGFLYNNCLNDPDELSVPGMMSIASPSIDQSYKHDLDALVTFERAGGAPEPTMTLGVAATGYARFGHRPEAWRSLLADLRQLGRTNDLAALQSTIRAAAHAEAANGRWASAYSLFSLAAEYPLDRTPWLMIDTLVWRAAMRFRLGWPAVETDLTPLRNALKKMRYGSDAARYQVLFAEALNTRSRAPSAAVKLLTRIIEARPRAQERLLLEALFVRARIHRELRDDAAAAADLEAALRSIVILRHRAMNYRQAYAETAEAILGELASIYEKANDSRRLLAAIRLAVEGDTGNSKSVGSNLTVARYVKSGTRLLIVVSHAGQDRIVRVDGSVEAITHAVDELTTCIETGTSPCDINVRQLGSWLLDPITELDRSSALHVLLPAVLARIPFSVLRRGAAGRRLIEDMDLVVLEDRTFKATDAVKAIHVHPVSKATERVVTIGDPSFDQQAFAGLPRLPSAHREAQDVITIHGGGVLLTDGAATSPRVQNALTAAHVADIATHAVVREDDPSRSYLLFAPTKLSSGLLYLHEIEHLDLCHLELVVLAGCHTAAPVQGEGSASSLARAFLAAGAKHVVGSMWEIDDEVARTVACKLHREIASGTGSAEALRRVQLEMMRSQDEGLRSLRAWGALQIYASTQ